MTDRLTEDALTSPISSHQLRRFALRMSRRAPSDGLGAHLRQKAGQSMEFREFVEYQPGDDIRWVDWLASARTGSEDQLLMRRFEAEEQRTICLILDGRASLHLPEAAPKVQAMVWTMLCLVEIAVSSGDQIILATVGSTRDAKPVKCSGSRARGEARRLAEALLAPPDWSEHRTPNIGALRKLIPPVATGIFLTDALFHDATHQSQIASLLTAFQKGYRQLILAEFNAWPMERMILAAGPLKLGGLFGTTATDRVVDAPDMLLDETEQALRRHVKQMRRRWSAGALVWPDRGLMWPADLGETAFRTWFATQILTAPFLSPVLSRI